MNDINNLFFELIQASLGTRICLSHTPNEDEWGELYAMAKKQSLVGICFAGVQRLQTQQQTPPEMLYLTWMGMAAKIQQRNEVVNRQCVELQAKLSADGFRSYIMKGQANASLYQCGVKNGSECKEGKESCLSGLRQSGDIDVYLEGGLDKVLAYARTFGEVAKVNELEMSVPVFSDPSTRSGEHTEVEFHYRPFIMRNPWKNRKLQKFFKEQEEIQFSNSLILDKEKNLAICAPTIAFNLVHQLVHTYHHFITEGVGLRQLMDYYMVLRTVQEVSEVSKVQEVVRSLGLNRFASALMWVIAHVFANTSTGSAQAENENFYPWQPNEKDGRMLLDEILMSGNFGHSDERAKDINTSRWKAFWYVNGKTFRFWRFDHWAWFWSPVWRIYHFLWRKIRAFK